MNGFAFIALVMGSMAAGGWLGMNLAKSWEINRRRSFGVNYGARVRWQLLARLGIVGGILAGGLVGGFFFHLLTGK